MAMESLFERGELADWREFVRAMKMSAEIAKSAIVIAERHEDGGSAALARILVARHHPMLLEKCQDVNCLQSGNYATMFQFFQ